MTISRAMFATEVITGPSDLDLLSFPQYKNHEPLHLKEQLNLYAENTARLLPVITVEVI